MENLTRLLSLLWEVKQILYKTMLLLLLQSWILIFIFHLCNWYIFDLWEIQLPSNQSQRHAPKCQSSVIIFNYKQHNVPDILIAIDTILENFKQIFIQF